MAPGRSGRRVIGVSARIAILGATGHVGKCLTAGLLARGGYSITAVVRNAPRLKAFLSGEAEGAACAVRSFEDFRTDEFDAVVNCVGVGTPGAVTEAGAGIFEITERFDALVLDYQKRHPDTRSIAFSSGAAYCGDFAEPASEAAHARVNINSLAPTDYYGIAKLASESKHRAMADRPIVDLRLFGLFSRYADMGAHYFMTDVYHALERQETLKVAPENVVRDYIDPDDLCSMVCAVLDAEPCNDVFDLYSAAPVSKFDILTAFAARYGLTYDVLDSPVGGAATGSKPNYYSTNHRAARLGYSPAYTSIESLHRQVDTLLELQGGAPRE